MLAQASFFILLIMTYHSVSILGLVVTEKPPEEAFPPLEARVSPTVEVIHEWATLEYDWKYSWVQDYYAKRGWYNASRNLLSGIDVYKSDIYVTVARMSSAVPSGLNKVVTVDGRSVLRPFPSFGRNEIGACGNLQFPSATFTDANTGYMYVVDVGRVGLKLKPGAAAHCPPKLIVLDLNSRGAVFRSHDLPETVVPRRSNMVSDLVLDYGCRNSSKVKYVYITDTGNAQIIVFDLQTNRTWAFRDQSMKSDVDLVSRTRKVNYTLPVSGGGIAIDHEFKHVCYSRAGSRVLYQIPTFVLRNSSGDFSRYLKLVGNMASESNGMASGTKHIYYGAVGLNALFSWSINQDGGQKGSLENGVPLATQRLVAQDDVKFRWVTSMKLDTNRHLWLVSNRAPEFFSGKMNFIGVDGANFRILRVIVDDLPYIFKTEN